MNINTEAIEHVVYEARADFEAGRVPEALLTQLYKQYCPDIDARSFVAMAREIFPIGNCGLTSLYLRSRLQGGEVTYGTYAGKGHTIWHVGGIVMADITGDQYGGPKVYVGPLMEPWSLETRIV